MVVGIASIIIALSGAYYLFRRAGWNDQVKGFDIC